MAAPKACPHAPVEASYAWVCHVCGFRLLERRPLGWAEWRVARRSFRREIDEWRNGE